MRERLALAAWALLLTSAMGYPARGIGPPGGVTASGAVIPSEQAPRPNVVLILTDDQRAVDLNTMPTVQAELVGKGLTFADAFVENSLCCPSRASILTGQLDHTTGVWTNKPVGDPPLGGWPAFIPHEGSTIATALHDVGYHTALVGKYFNQYDDPSHVPPGWDRWVASAGPTPGHQKSEYYNYVLSVDGVAQTYGKDPGDYSTDVFTGFATDFIDTAPADQPLFLYFAPHAPHVPSTPSVSHAHDPETVPPFPPSFNEADVSDKPQYVQDAPPLSDKKILTIRRHYKNVQRTLASVDDAAAALLKALAKAGRLENTLFIYMSDNGDMYGEHRLTGKTVPYEESIRVPLILRWDGHIPPDSVRDQLVENIDLAPTFAELAGASLQSPDGTSLSPLFEHPGSRWRQDFLIDHLALPHDTEPSYCGVRTNGGYVFVRYGDGEEELYDLKGALDPSLADPYELTNRANDPRYAGVRDALYGRTVQLCDPPPPGYSFSPGSSRANGRPADPAGREPWR